MADNRYLYQVVMDVPGLTGTWQQRNKDLYYKLGAPFGPYKGNLKQNNWLLSQILGNNYFKNYQPWNTQATTATTTATTDPLAAVADPVLDKVETRKPFSEVMPQETWNSVFDEWTRNFVNEYVLPEWQEETYNPALEEMIRGLYNTNQQMGVSGQWRSGVAQSNLQRTAEEGLKQEESLRKQYQSDIANLRDKVLETWANPLYAKQMEMYSNAPWGDYKLNSDNLSQEAQGMISDLSTQYGISDQASLGELITGLENIFNGEVPTTPTVRDWTAPVGNIGLIKQYT